MNQARVELLASKLIENTIEVFMLSMNDYDVYESSTMEVNGMCKVLDSLLVN